MVTRAAVKIFDNKQQKEIIIPCHRHCDAFQILHDFGYTIRDFKELGQGFLNEHDEYMSRLEAMKEAKRCRQVSDFKLVTNELYSEDLW